MTDDLVKRLREYGDWPQDVLDREWAEWSHKAADRIEKLETNMHLQLDWYLSNKRVLDNRIAELEAALREIAWSRKGGPLRNKLAEKYEKIAIEALEGKDGT